MITSVVCIHGHPLESVANAESMDKLCCPICGAIIKRPKDLGDMTAAFDVTFVPHSVRQSSTTGKADSDRDNETVAGKASDSSDGRTLAGAGEEISVSAGRELDAFAPTSDFAGPGTSGTEPSPKHKSTKPPALPGIEVLEELGRGGFGVVYRAFDEKHSREVALKTLQRMGPDELVRFKNEFRALADIAHPNLASLYELVSDGRTWCFTMEVLRGVSFLNYVWSEFESLKLDSTKARVAEPINQSSRLSLRRMNRLYDGIKQLVVGLYELHRAGKLHSDIKPSNVLVTLDGRLVLLDFGLIAEIQRDADGQLPAVIQGTPHYMSPEQVACKPLTEASDWYAVGVMLYQILTGRLPFHGKAATVMLRKQYEVPKEPAKRQTGIPPELNKLCMALLETDPAKRPSAAEILKAVDAEDLAVSMIEQDAAKVRVTAELVGRETQFEVLERVYQETVQGKTRSVFIHGDSGMGKSALIRSFIDGLKQTGQTIVLEGRCYEQESVPFKTLDSLIDALVVYLLSAPRPTVNKLIPKDTLPLFRLFPVLAQIPAIVDSEAPPIESADQHELRSRAKAALRELLVRLSDLSPVVLYIDDLQWGDEDSSHLLADLLRPPAGPRLLLLGSYRRENANDSPALISLDDAYGRGPERPHRLDLPVAR